MTGLSDADRQHVDALMTSAWDCVTVSEFDIYAVALTDAVEAIVRRRVTEALTEAADELDSMVEETFHRNPELCEDADEGYCHRDGAFAAYSRAVRSVRVRIPK